MNTLQKVYRDNLSELQYAVSMIYSVPKGAILTIDENQITLTISNEYGPDKIVYDYQKIASALVQAVMSS